MLYEDETIVWRFALPRLGWWRRAQRYRLAHTPAEPGPVERPESHKRQTWGQYRSWSRIAGACCSPASSARSDIGTSKIFYKIVPHFDAQSYVNIAIK